MEKKTVAVFFGGRSGEHVVSLRSAASIMDAIDKESYNVIPVGITREGVWYTDPDIWLNLWEKRPLSGVSRVLLATDPTNPGLLIWNETDQSAWRFQPVDIAFPVLHGTYGEDGTIQGLFEMAGVPYVGSGVLASSTAMDKAVMKLLFKERGLPVAPYLYFYHWQWNEQREYWEKQVDSEIGFPCFVKPANLGSSVGISKAHLASELPQAVEEALLYDEKIVIEQFVDGREIECAVLGDVQASASRPGELIPCNEFYDYRAKYIDDRSTLIIPVELGSDLEKIIKEYAVTAFQAVEASGLARVDFFLHRITNKVIINEINTLPGFTSISMYPKLWEVSGIAYNDLVKRLLEIAEARFKRRRLLMVTPPE